MKKALLSGRKIEKSFGENKVLNGIDIDIYPEDFTVIMGASGSGKSTLLYMLSGMDKVSGGEISYKENDITSASEKEMTKLRADDFGFVFQRTHLVSNLTLYENIVLAGYISGKITEEESVSRANELVEKMNLTEAKMRLPSAVSGGEAQRAAVARAVISKPELIFADEPTGALNKSNTDEVLNLFTDLNKQGQTILLVTHDKEAALRGNRILYIEDGAVIGELSLEAYQGRNKQREDKLSGWLESLRW
ncbi:MAG: ATP-binding cassette domain-containing protein [Oscillospiraceae bacterium]|nr:ATP-binding cassette domain-containing protein [Oscillospiraceae bacterium]